MSYSGLTCIPLDSYEEVLLFLEYPPPWRSLCKGITPHSQSLIKNIEINKISNPSLETPEIFCHFDAEPSEDGELRRYDEKKLPKTLVCHDMANGYHDDSIIDGTGKYDAYTFYNWSGIDIFCYFSHHLVTIPPLGWINAAHAHGVKVIGTIITEWKEGAAFWERILASEETCQTFASALVAIAKTLKFEGWLLNIENNISQPDALLEFVRRLHRMLHREVPAAELIWYDSVTVSGELSWQNALNTKNRVFFDACDGIFTNYSWSEQDVASSAAAAGARLADLYIGLDVWGRNFYGGGKFNTQAAVNLAHKYGCSLAIFAPAWTHEAMSEDSYDINYIADGDHLNKMERFLLRDRALWASIWPYLNTRVPCTLPLQTSFCRGQGLLKRRYGEVILSEPWFNLRDMQYQPNSALGPHGYSITTTQVNVRSQTISNTVISKEIFNQSRPELNPARRTDNDASANDNSLNALGADEPENSRTGVSLKDLFKIKDMRERESEGDANSNTGSEQVPVDLNRIEETLYKLVCIPEEQECLELCFEDSFMGGACLKVNPSEGMSTARRQIRLFHADIYCQETLVLGVVTKCLPEYPDQRLNVKLSVKSADGEDLGVVLIGRSLLEGGAPQQDAEGIVTIYPLDENSKELKELQNYLLLNSPDSYIPMENAYGWSVRYYLMNLPKSRVTSVHLYTESDVGPLLLGFFGICERLYEAESLKEE